MNNEENNEGNVCGVCGCLLGEHVNTIRHLH